jgi:regulator of sirC expression with transglutaminase-like and TPR domain
MIMRIPLLVLLSALAGSHCLAGHPSRLLTRINDRADISRLALRTETQHVAGKRLRAYLRALDHEASRIRSPLPAHPTEGDLLAALNEHFFGPEGFASMGELSAPENVSFAAVLDNRRGTCVGLAIAYLALARRLGLDAHAVATPVHLFVRIRLGGTVRNVELLEVGSEIDDATYQRRYKIDETSIASGVFMRDLTSPEVIAQLLSNQAVALSKQAKLDDALARYDAALALAPQLVAAWYNRGIDLMNAGRLKEALVSFTRAIELYPSDAQAHNNRGLAKVKLGDVEGARSDFQRALELQPGMKEAEQNLKRLLAGRPNPR